MRHVLLGAWLAACTSSSSPPAQTTVPDRFEENLDVIVRSVTHPCGADQDLDGDGVVDVHWRYTYDGHGRSKRDQAKDLTGAVTDQIDYTWDNAGNMVDQVETLPGFSTDRIEDKTVFDSLGRQVQFQDIRFHGDDMLQRSTIDYSGYDELGHATVGASTREDFEAGTTITMTRAYGFDGLGRRISLDVHFSTGELFQGWTHTYDDVARTVVTTVTEPHTLRGDVGFTDIGTDSFDEDFHWISSHDDSTSLADQSITTTDTTNTWQGDRQLDSTTTIVIPMLLNQTSSFTYRYSCN